MLWLPVLIILLSLLDGPKTLLIAAGLSDDSINMSKRGIPTRKYEQAGKRFYEVRACRSLENDSASSQPIIARSGVGGEEPAVTPNMSCDQEKEKRRAKI